MKWRWTSWRRVLALVALLGLCSLGAQADNIGRSEKQDLKGQFGFNLTEVRCLLSGGVGRCDVEFCPHSGTLSFDGVGTVTIYEVRQCPDEIPQGTFRTYSYSVASDESFEIEGGFGGLIFAQARGLDFQQPVKGGADVYTISGVAVRI